MRRVRIAAAVVGSLSLLSLGAPAASAPAERVNLADRSSVSHPANGPLVFGFYEDTLVVPFHDPQQYYTLGPEVTAVSPDGRRLAYTDDVQTSPTSSRCCELFVSRLDGSNERQITDETRYAGDQAAGGTPAWSPDGRQIVVNYDGLWIFDVRTGRLGQRLTNSRPIGADVEPTWSPDGRLIVFESIGPTRGLFVIQPDGRGLRRLTIPPVGTYDQQPDWSPDARWLIMRTNRWAPRNQRNKFNLGLVSRDGKTIRQLTSIRRPVYFEQPTWSPDGRKIAVARKKPFRPEHPSDGEGTVAIYRADGTFLRWFEGGHWTQDMDDFYWDSIDWAPLSPIRR